MLNPSCEEMRSLCIKNQWFTRGTNEQYEKLFQALEADRPLDEIATIIWLCSDDCWVLEGIKAYLKGFMTEKGTISF